jgi:hypothetical protein
MQLSAGAGAFRFVTVHIGLGATHSHPEGTVTSSPSVKHTAHLQLEPGLNELGGIWKDVAVASFKVPQ